MTAAFIGHRKVIGADALEIRLRNTVFELIDSERVDVFLFGSKSFFDSLCLRVVSEIKRDRPFIQRVYVRAEYPYIGKDYADYLLQSYEGTFFSERAKNAGRAAYIKRNTEMIDRADYCIFYYNTSYVPPFQRQSGTKIAYEYALAHGKKIINLFND